jgi:hypothetical protein
VHWNSERLGLSLFDSTQLGMAAALSVNLKPETGEDIALMVYWSFMT